MKLPPSLHVYPGRREESFAMRGLVNSLCLVAACGAVTVATAAAVRLQARPNASDNGTTLTVTGSLAGLGANDFTVRVTATGSATVQCVNPSGKEPPGQKRQVAVTASGEQQIRASDISAGNAYFAVSTTEPDVRIACPSDQWNAEVSDVAFRTVTLRVFQDGRVVLRRTWSM
jgi:hypothetical protein